MHFNSCIWVSVLQKSLSKDFKYVEVAVVQCPDLTQEPYNLAKPGIVIIVDRVLTHELCYQYSKYTKIYQ